MENPISGLFDLAEEVSSQAPEMKKKLMFSLVFITFWLGMNLVFLLWALGGRPLFVLPLLVLFIFGFNAFRVSYFSLNFFEDFAKRHTALGIARDREIFEPIPPGANELGRFVTFLKRSSKDYGRILHEGNSLQNSPVFRNFPLELAKMEKAPNLVDKLLNDKKPRGVFIKVLPQVSMAHLQTLESMVGQIAKEKGLLPELVVILQDSKAELSDELYHYLTRTPHAVRLKRREIIPFPIQVVREIEGAYDFIPYFVRAG